MSCGPSSTPGHKAAQGHDTQHMIIAYMSASMSVNTDVKQAKISALNNVSKAFELSRMFSSLVFAYLGSFKYDERPNSAASMP